MLDLFVLFNQFLCFASVVITLFQIESFSIPKFQKTLSLFFIYFLCLYFLLSVLVTLSNQRRGSGHRVSGVFGFGFGEGGSQNNVDDVTLLRGIHFDVVGNK